MSAMIRNFKCCVTVIHFTVYNVFNIPNWKKFMGAKATRLPALPIQRLGYLNFNRRRSLLMFDGAPFRRLNLLYTPECCKQWKIRAIAIFKTTNHRCCCFGIACKDPAHLGWSGLSAGRLQDNQQCKINVWNNECLEKIVKRVSQKYQNYRKLIF